MKPSLVRLSILAFPFVAFGCTDATAPATEVPKFSCLSNSETMRLPENLRATLPDFRLGDPDDAYVSISESAPGGFAGLFIENNKYVLTFTDPAAAESNRLAIQNAFASTSLAADAPHVPTAEFRGARWTFAELGEWFRYVVPNLNIKGISGYGIDEKSNSIRISVVDEAARAQVEAELATLGVSCNLVTTSIMPYATFD